MPTFSGIRRSMSRRFRPLQDDDTKLMMLDNPLGQIDEEGDDFVPEKARWRPLPLGTWQPLLHSEKDLDNVTAVFPGGVFLKIASNANPFHVELVLEAPPLQETFSVVVPPSGAVYDLNLMSPPEKGKPRSEEWCNMFGIITRENLSNGIIERREDGTLVVYRTFRMKPDMLTPFGLYFSEDPMRISSADYMVIRGQDFEDLLALCCGAKASDVRIMAKPLLDSERDRIHDEMTLPLHIELTAPVVLTVPPPPTTPTTTAVRSAESLL